MDTNSLDQPGRNKLRHDLSSIERSDPYAQHPQPTTAGATWQLASFSAEYGALILPGIPWYQVPVTHLGPVVRLGGRPFPDRPMYKMSVVGLILTRQSLFIRRILVSV